jgi:hypothetical protein
MGTRIATGFAVLVIAVVFGFVFWNQFKINQQNLAGGPGNGFVSSDSTAVVHHKSTSDTLNAIEKDLNNINENAIDSDSGQMSTQLRGF